MSTNNYAIWVGENGQLTTRAITEQYKPMGSEVLIEVEYSGINPADHKHGVQLGIKNTIAGYDFCGTVVVAGSTSKFAEGTQVFGHTPSGLGRSQRYGTHQQYLICPDDWARALPPNLPSKAAACLSVACRTTSDALFNLLHIPLPGEVPSQPSQPPGPILIWGGSSSLGFSAIQYCKASGMAPILVTASATKHQRLVEFGADACFDYSDADVVQQIRKAVGTHEQPLLRIFDAVGAVKSGDLARSCGDTGATFVSCVDVVGGVLPVPSSEVDFHIEIAGREIVVPARKEDAERSQRGLTWAIANYGKGFVIPEVRVVTGNASDALQAIRRVATEGSNFGKYVIQQPMEAL